MNSRHLFMWAFILASAGIAWNTVKKCGHLPFPARFVYTGATFGLLDIFAAFNEELASVMAIGLVIATYVSNGWKPNCYVPTTSQPQTTSFLAGSFQEGNQPLSYAEFMSPGAASAQPQGSTSFNATTGGKPPGSLA